MTVLDWWKRHPRWRWQLWVATSSKEDFSNLVLCEQMKNQFRRDAEQAWRTR